MIRIFITVMCLLALAGCKVTVVVPLGGEVVASHGLTCAADSECSITVDDDTFDSTFTAVPAPGYAFAGWQRAHLHFCGDSRNPCYLSTLDFADFPALLEILVSEIEFLLEPLFVRKDVLVYKTGNSLFKVSFDGEVSEITGEGSPEPYLFSLSPDISRVAYHNDGSIEDQVLEIVRLDTLSLESRVTGLTNLWPGIHWFDNSRSLTVRADSGSRLARIDAGNDIPIILLESPTMGSEGRVTLGLYNSSVDGNRLGILQRIFESAGFIPTETRIYTYEYDDPMAQLLVSTVSTGGNGFYFSRSPFTTDLAYQARDERDIFYPNVKNNYPAGPLILRKADGSEYILFDPATDSQERDLDRLTWLSPDQLLLSSPHSIEIRDLEGETQLAIGGRSLVSPDLEKIAFQAGDVYLLDIETAESVPLGPGAVDIAIFSTLKWSADSRFLAWNDWEFETQSEKNSLYTHDSFTGTTELVSGKMPRNSSSSFKWSPGWNLLNYLVREGDQLQHVLMNPLNGKQAVVREGVNLLEYLLDDDLTFWKDSASSVFAGKLPLLTIQSLRKIFAEQTVRLMHSPSGNYILIQEIDGENPEWYLHLIGTSKIEPVNGTSGVPLRSENFKFLY